MDESRRLSEEEEEAEEMLELAKAVVGSGSDSSKPSSGLMERGSKSAAVYLALHHFLFLP